MTARAPRAVVVRNAAALAALSPTQRAKHDRAFAAVADARHHGWSLSHAARANDIRREDVLRYAPGVFTKGSNGIYAARPYDRHYRGTMQALTTEGRITVEVRDSRTASLLGQHASAVNAYLEGRGDRALRTLRRRTFTIDKHPYTLLTDKQQIDHLARAGEVSFEDLYVHAA